jgi:arylsulfatase A-like enzyme
MPRLVLTFCALLMVSFLDAAEPKKPNIVVIVADDLGYADVGFHGCKDIPTPHLDALAKSGVVCTNGYVSHPFCSPTRAGLLTGRYQQRFGHEENPKWLPNDKDVGLPLDQVTIADMFKKAGYSTGAIGKWHLGAHPSFHPNRRGFDHYFGCLGGGHQYLEHNTFKTDPMKARQEYFIPLVRNETPVEESEHLTDVLSREAVAFVARQKEKPFFLYYAFNAPHTPLQATPKTLERVKGITDEKLRKYAALICGMDDAVGQLMSKLKETGQLDNTLVFFFSDNGGPVGTVNCRNTPLRGAKGQMYEGGIRVPFVVSWPKVLKPGQFESPVSSLDVFSTSVAVAGAESPKGVTLDGINLLPLLQSEAKSSSDRALFWRTGGGEAFAMRKGPYKLVKPNAKSTELYDLTTDLGERTNLARSKPDVLESMQKQLDDWNATLVAPKWEPLFAPRPKK